MRLGNGVANRALVPGDSQGGAAVVVYVCCCPVLLLLLLLGVCFCKKTKRAKRFFVRAC